MEKSPRPKKKGLAGSVFQHMRKRLGVGMALALFQQITGINAVLYYVPSS